MIKNNKPHNGGNRAEKEVTTKTDTPDHTGIDPLIDVAKPALNRQQKRGWQMVGAEISGDIERIREALQFMPVGAHDERVRVAFMVKSELGDMGRDLWDEWRDGRGSDEAASVWKSASEAGKLTIGTLFYEAKANGWRDDGGYQMPTPEELAERKSMAIERTAREELEITRERAETAKKALAIFKEATEAKANHPYLQRKRVSPVVTLREIEVDVAAAILGYSPKSGGNALSGRLLVVPVRQGDGISTLELIDGDSRKAALAGRGSKTCGYWATERLPNGPGDSLTILIGEGVATMLSAREASGHPAIATLSAGNLPAVAKVMRERYPAAALVILADIMKLTGEADPHAIEAAQSVGGKLAIPSFGASRDPGMTDFNDMAVIFGLEAVRGSIANAALPASSNPQPSVSDVPTGDSESQASWPAPQPLATKVAPEPYPIDALPDSIRAAVEEVAGFVKAPLPMVASSALAALSLTIQAHVDIKRAERLHGPVGLFLLTIAESGERKSTCDGFFTTPIRDFEKTEAEAAKPILKDYKADMEAWDAKRGGIKEKIRQLSKEGKSTAEMESALRDLEHEVPESPKIPRLLYADATPEALAYGLAKQWPAAGIVSAEAGIVFGSHGMSGDSVMRNLATLNQLWDGNSLTIDRRTSESFTVSGARLTMALQVQEPTLRSFFDKSGALARGTGFLARFLVAWPESTQGYRPFTDPPAHWPHLAKFHVRLSEILNQAVPIDDSGALTPALLSLTHDAKTAWIEYHDVIEAELASGGKLYDVRDVASKSADNAARLATLFQMFEHGIGGAVGLACFDSASRIAAWHLTEARRFFGEVALPVELLNAARLDTWLIDHCQRAQTFFVGKNHVRQNGPLRDGMRLDAAIRELAELDRIRLVNDGKRLSIQVNPMLLGAAL